MFRLDKRRCLPSLLSLAAFFTVQAVLAQPPAETPAQTPAPTPDQIPASSPHPNAPIAAPPVQQSPTELGDSLMHDQRYQAAIEAYKKGPRDSAVLENKLGIAYQMMLNSAEAIRCYQASLRLDPGNAFVINNLGTVFDSQKEYGAAEKMYRKALKIDPHSALIEKNLGTVLMAQHKYRKGAEAYQTAMAMNPKIFETTGGPKVDKPATAQDRGALNFYLAKSFLRAGNSDRAIEYLRMAINEGFTSPRKIEADSEFASLRGLPAFEQMMAALRSP
jgi:tetratricopeptide (TPR) repeat protein